MMLELFPCCLLIFQVKALLTEQLVMLGLVTKGKLQYRSGIVLQVSKLSSHRFTTKFMHYHKTFQFQKVCGFQRESAYAIFLKTAKESNCYKVMTKWKFQKHQL